MPPLRPKSRRLHGTRVGSALRPRTSPTPPVQMVCNMLATFSNGTAFGYLSTNLDNGNGTYYKFQQTQGSDSLRVQFSYIPDENYRQLSFKAENGYMNQQWPYLGIVMAPEAFDRNLGRPTNHAYLAATQSTEPDLPAVTGPNSFDNNRPMEAAIWAYGYVDNSILAQWINDDNSGYSRTPTTTFLYIFEESKLVATGDPLAILSAYAPGKVEILRFKCATPAYTTPYGETTAVETR
ncbi:hypothetical protein FRC12_016697 [Ceratobasidium sp. 428]|nr:hypothetical protein FRC12_016697 [Ceratobasidium sp. 428]